MSSANRGAIRHQDDLYETPHWLVEALVPRLKRLFEYQGITAPRILEPCCGNGRVSRVLRHHFPNACIVTSDIQEYPELDQVIDFRDMEAFRGEKFDLVMSNPPFLHAEEIILRANGLLTSAGKTIMLERMNFLGSKQREPWLSTHVPGQNFSPRRPSFLPTRTSDSVEYSWFEFDDHPNFIGSFEYLPTMTCDGCKEVHYHRSCLCKLCDYGYCKKCFPDHKCKLFGRDFLWGCVNHPEVAMKKPCKKKITTRVDGKEKKVVCGLPLCEECWETHDHP